LKTGLPGLGRSERAAADEPPVFTDHVRALAAGEPLESPHFAALWTALRAAVRRELKRRGLWESPPSYLGVYGGASWEPGDGGKSHESPLEELIAETYTYVFVSRLRSLQAQLKLKPDVEGLVVLNIRHFLHERQKEHDPIGSQVFTVLHSAVAMAIEQGDLRLLAGSEAIRNDTVLGFEQGMDYSGRGRPEIAYLVARWNDELLPDLVTSRGHRQEEVVRRLRERLPDLLREGIGTFRFKDLIDPLKADVRARWAALLELEQGEAVPQLEGAEAETVRVVAPDRGIEERQFFRKLVECVSRALADLEVDSKTREYLGILWQFLRMQASGRTEAPPTMRLNRALGAELAAGDEERPSHRKLSEQLRVPRDRLPRLYRTIGDLVRQCTTAISGKTAVKPLEERSSHDEGV
jgi:hypothetical protein